MCTLDTQKTLHAYPCASNQHYGTETIGDIDASTLMSSLMYCILGPPVYTLQLSIAIAIAIAAVAIAIAIAVLLCALSPLCALKLTCLQQQFNSNQVKWMTYMSLITLD